MLLKYEKRIIIVILFGSFGVLKMDAISSTFSLMWSAPYLLLVPLYVILSPLCIISSSLFESVLGMSFDLDDQTAMLLLVLLTIWGLSVFFIIGLIKNRTCKEMFFYSFVFYLSCFNFILIGITYSLLRRVNLVEEMLAKVLSTMLLVYFAEKTKIKTDSNCCCRICFEGTSHHDCLILPCKHTFHENCLWDWTYIKNVCPLCFKSRFS